MPRSLCSLALLAGLLFAGDAVAQTQRLDIKDGLWEVTVTSHVNSPQTEQAVNNLPPQQRAQVLAAMRAAQEKGTVQINKVCLSADDIGKGNILTKEDSCHKDLTSSSKALDVHQSCGGLNIASRIDRTDAEHFTGSVKQVDGASPPNTINHAVSAKWLGQDCVAIEKQRVQSLASVAGVNRDVVAFLPYIPPVSGSRPKEANFGSYFYYSWRLNNTIPAMRYRGGLPEVPQGVMPAVYFHGTDGQYLYVTLVTAGSLCGPESIHLKVDRAGTPTKIGPIPKGLLGGTDQIDGHPPCQ